MTWPDALTAGRLADLVLGVMALEALLLIGFLKRPAGDVLIAIAPGAALVLALRLALDGAPIWAVATCVALAGPLHVWDMRRRGLM